MNKFDRVVLKEDFCKNNKLVLKSGIIGTIRDFIDKSVLIQIDFIDNQPKYIGVPENYLRMVTAEDLDSIESCTKILNKLYHPNSVYITKEGIEYTIKGIRLASNELEDEFTVSVKDGTFIESKLISRNFLDNNTSLLPYEYNEDSQFPLAKHIEVPEVIPPKEDIQSEYDIKIVIGKYNFMSNGKEITMPIIKIKEFKEFNEVFNKLKEFINER